MKNSTSSLRSKKSDFGSFIFFTLAVISGICGIICSFKIYRSSAVYNSIAILPIYDFDKIIQNLLSSDVLLLFLLSLSFFSGICVILNYVFIFAASFLNCYTLCVYYTYLGKVTSAITVSSLLASAGILVMCCIAAEACKFSFGRLRTTEKNLFNNPRRNLIKFIRIALEFALTAFFIVAAAVFLKNGGK